MKRQALFFWTVIVLAVIGVVIGIITLDSDLFWSLLPVLLIVGIAFFAYRITSRSRVRGPGGKKIKVKPSQKTMAKVASARKGPAATPPKRKSYPFQVIEGSKGKNDDDHLPKYH
ncbi:hypothetical protein [Paenibacillus tepidiphilus]|uniref:hypothetical protein n=1 Tax=Paenibacillus tepidiphilus TaxID=2608683 RepID=UPI00123A1CA3|nr:hypothetical protein [Paenibacillus tepidiphilus]